MDPRISDQTLIPVSVWCAYINFRIYICMDVKVHKWKCGKMTELEIIGDLLELCEPKVADMECSW